MAPSWTIQSLSRGLHLLELMAEQPEGTTVKWLSAVSGIPLSTCYHLINTLAEAGYVQKDTRRQLYTLSYKVSYLHHQLQMGRALPDDLPTVAHRVARETHETTYVAKWEHQEIVIHHIVEGDQAVKVRSLYVGYRDHAFLHALGKSVLAHLSPKDFRAYYVSHPPEPRTPYSRVEWDALQRERLRTRERGYSLDEEEWATGVCCVGVPIFDYTGGIWGSLAISLPRNRFDRLNPAVINYLQQEARWASSRLGWAQAAQ